MKTLTQELWMEVLQRRAIVSIHDEVDRLVAESGVQDGFILVNAMHIAAGAQVPQRRPTIAQRFIAGLESATQQPSPVGTTARRGERLPTWRSAFNRPYGTFLPAAKLPQR